MTGIRSLIVAVSTFALLASLAPAASSVGSPDPGTDVSPRYCDAGVLDVEDLPGSVARSECDLVGRTVTSDGIEVVVPPPGEGIIVDGIGPDGDAGLEVRTTTNGTVEFVGHGEATNTREAAGFDSSAPAHDTIDGALPVRVPWNEAGTTANSTTDSVDHQANAACSAEDEFYQGPDRSVWYRLDAQSNDQLLFQTRATRTYHEWAYVSVAGVFTRSAGGAMTAITCEKNSFRTRAGETYYLRVGSTFGAVEYTFNGNVVTAANRPPHDAFTDAKPLTLPFGETTSAFDLATTQPGEPTPRCGPRPQQSVWYRVRPGLLRRLALDSGDAYIAVYRGDTLSSLVRAGCVPPGNGYGFRTLLLRSGATHYLQVFSGAGSDTASVRGQSGEPCRDCPPPCAVRDYAHYDGIAPRKPLEWRFNPKQVPASLGAKTALQAVKRGMNVITSSQNDCGLADKVSARTVYLGRTRRGASLCRSDRVDGVNAVEFAEPDGLNLYGLTCSRTRLRNRRWHIVESDMQLNPKTAWTTNPDRLDCSHRADLVGVAAHETGHVFGLTHPSRSSTDNLTMHAEGRMCTSAYRTLGRGDILGLRALY